VQGTLYVVATPLGNLEDLAPRAVQTLTTVRCIACEDTRRTRKLLERFGIRTPTLSCHRFNERERLEPLLEILRRGESVALVADAGTPGISDPGALLVRAAFDEGAPVSPVPGPSAAVALLSASGLAGDRFLFEGFLPHRAGQRRRRLRELCDIGHAVVAFESPRRIRQTLVDIAAVLGDRIVVLGRELTKVHETILRGTAAQLLRALAEHDEIRGEVTLVLSGTPQAAGAAAADPEATRSLAVWRRALDAAGGDRREALRQASRELGAKRPELYRLLSELGEIES
jgi:16S rRNA (cytidine1402-2'-O)-methyltransferase